MSVREKIKQLFDEEIEAQRLSDVDSDVLYAWHTIRDTILALRDDYVEVDKKKLQDRIFILEKRWKEHLASEGGSCYCMASTEACLPEVITELKKVLSVVEAK